MIPSLGRDPDGQGSWRRVVSPRWHRRAAADPTPIEDSRRCLLPAASPETNCRRGRERGVTQERNVASPLPALWWRREVGELRGVAGGLSLCGGWGGAPGPPRPRTRRRCARLRSLRPVAGLPTWRTMKRELAGSEQAPRLAVGSALCTNRGGVRASLSLASARPPSAPPTPRPFLLAPSTSLPLFAPLLLSLFFFFCLRGGSFCWKRRGRQLQPHPGTCHHL